MTLISKEDLIAALKPFCKTAPYLRIWAMIEKQPEASPWIDASKQLPKPGIEVVTISKHQREVQKNHIVVRNGVPKWFYGCSTYPDHIDLWQYIDTKDKDTEENKGEQK